MTGTVERSQNKYVSYQTTHLAFVRRNSDKVSRQTGPVASQIHPAETGPTWNKTFLHSNESSSNCSAITLLGEESSQVVDQSMPSKELLVVIPESERSHSRNSGGAQTLNNQNCCPVQCVETVSSISKTCFSSKSGERYGQNIKSRFPTIKSKNQNQPPVILPADLLSSNLDTFATTSLKATSTSTTTNKSSGSRSVISFFVRS